MIVPALLALAIANVARAQDATASLFPVGFQMDPLEGEVIGTGADGTTYVLSAPANTLDVGYTVTVVQDATHVSEVAVVGTEGVFITMRAECELGSVEASCVEVVEGPYGTTITESGEYTNVPIPVEGAGSGATGGSSTSPSSSRSTVSSRTVTGVTATSSLRSGGDSTSGSDSGLPLSGGDSGGDSGSGAIKNGIIVMGWALPALLALANTL